MKKILTSILILLMTFQLQAQEIIKINLETVLELAEANSLTIKEYTYLRELALADMTTANEWWMPEITAGTALHQLWGNAMNTDGTIFTKINRQSFYGGAGVAMDLNFGEGSMNQISVKKNTAAIKYLSEAQKNKVLLEIIETYFDFFTAQLYYEAFETLKKQSDTITAQVALQVEAGMRFESERLLAESDNRHLAIEMLNAKLEFNEKSAKLLSLLNLDPEIRLDCMDDVLLPIDLIGDRKFDYDEVYDERPEMKGLALQIESLKLQRKIEMTGFMIPSLHVESRAYMFGDVFSNIEPTADINMSLYWQIPIAALATGGEMRRSKALLHLHENKIEMQKQEINREILQSRAQLIISKEQIEIAKEGDMLASEALLQSIQRQRAGLVLPFEVIQAQEIYIRARLDYLNAVSNFNKAQYRYYVAVGNEL